MPLEALEQEFENRFGDLLSERNRIHHEEEYSDIQLKAVGLGDLLSLSEDQMKWLKVSRGSYLRIRRGWVKTVENTAKQLDLFVGVIATLMLSRCQFLLASEKGRAHMVKRDHHR